MKQRLYHGRPAGETFEPQIGTYLATDEAAAEVYAAMESEEGVLYTVELDLSTLDVAFVGWLEDEESLPVGPDVAIIQTALQEYEHWAFVLLTEAAVQATRVVDSQEFAGGDYWFCVLSPLDGCRETYLHEWMAETEPGDEVVPMSECPEHGSVRD